MRTSILSRSQTIARKLAPKWSGAVGGEKRMGYPVDFVLMLPIYENRFWYHDLIGQIADC